MSEFEFPDPAFVVFADAVPSKSALFRLIAKHAAEIAECDAKALEAQLNMREGLGSTGFGDGVAIPHGRIESLEKPFGVFVRLATPVDYDSVDDLPGTLVVAVVNFPKKQIGPFMSECLVTGFYNEDGHVALCVPDRPVPLGAKLG